MSADRQVSQLIEVADVVGDLGRNIAAAQKLLNKDYVESLQALMRTAAAISTLVVRGRIVPKRC